MQPRFAMALLRGPTTREEIRAARGVKDELVAHPAPPPSSDVAEGPHPVQYRGGYSDREPV
jgi:hypothetical protein